MLRIIREVQPEWAVLENVRGLTNWNGGMVFDEVQADLEAEGYEVLPFLLPACAVNAPHRRDRIWFIAHSNINGCERSDSEHEKYPNEGGEYALNDIEPNDVTNESGKGLEGKIGWGAKEQGLTSDSMPGNWENFPTQPPIRKRDDGLPAKLDGITFPKWRNESIKGYGNAIVPKIAFELFKVITSLIFKP